MDYIPERFIQGSRQFCPWCEDWDSATAFIALQMPPDPAKKCAPMFKHGGPDGCKKLHALIEEG